MDVLCKFGNSLVCKERLQMFAIFRTYNLPTKVLILLEDSCRHPVAIWRADICTSLSSCPLGCHDARMHNSSINTTFFSIEQKSRAIVIK
jgi:hypothetical protein